MTISEYIDHINESIARSIRHQAWIDADVLQIKGFTTGVIRRLYSNLCHLPKENPTYVEVGLFGGGSLISAINNNPELIAYGCEDFSQDFQNPYIRQHLEENLEKHKNDCKELTIIREDFFSTDLTQIKHPINIYNYDAIHEPWAQRKAITHIIDNLSDIAIITVDDFSWQEAVATPTRQGFEDAKDRLKIEREWLLWDGKPDSPIFHNGVAIFLVSKIN